MEKILAEQLENWAKQETVYQLVIVFLSVLLVVSFMSKHFKTIIDALPSIKKTWTYIQKKWFADAMFKKELLDRLEKMDTTIARVEAEVRYNGGSSMRDAVKRTEIAVHSLTEVVLVNKALRDITDLCSERMLFKMDQEGKCTFINDAFLKAFSYHESDILNYGFEDIVHEEDRHEMQLKWTKAINTKTPFRDEQRLKTGTGDLVKVLVRAFPIVVEGKLVEFSGTIEVL